MAKWIESEIKLTQGSISVNIRGGGMGVTGTNYGRDCGLSRHGNWYMLYNPKLNVCIPNETTHPKLNVCTLCPNFNNETFFFW